MKAARSKGIVAVIAGLAFVVLSACNRNRVNADYWERESERAELAQELKLMEYRMNQICSSQLGQMEALKFTLDGLDQRSLELTFQLECLVDEIGEMEVRNEECVQLAIKNQQASALGKSFDEFVLKNGRVLRKVLVTGVDDGGVEVRHEHGAAKLRYSDLCPDHQELFGLVEKTAVAAEARERQRALAYERWIDGELQVIRERQAAEALQRETNDHPRIARSYAMNGSSGSKTGALAQSATRVGDGNRYRYSRKRSYRPVYRQVFYYPAFSNRCRSFRAYTPKRNCSRRMSVAPFFNSGTTASRHPRIPVSNTP